MTSSTINGNYSFPNVSFSESVIGPLPFSPQWRNSIGVAGVFSRGPAIARIRNRSDFAYLFGEDDSKGSLFVRQAMLQGATDFYISRVMPDDKAASGAIFLQGGTNGTASEAFVGSGNERTVGMSLIGSYIGSPITPVGSYLGADVSTVPNVELTIPDFEGVGFFDFEVVERVAPSEVTASPAFDITAIESTAQNAVQIVSLSGAEGVLLKNNAKPGLVLGATSVITGYPTEGLEILSYPFETTAGTYNVYVKGVVTSAASGTPIEVEVKTKSSSDPEYFVLSYGYRSSDGASLPSNAIPVRTFLTGGSANGFFLVDSTVKTAKELSYLSDETGGLYSQTATGINISIGNAGSTTTTELVPSSTFSIPFIYGQVNVGETDTSATGFPNTSDSFDSGLAAVEILNQLKKQIATNQILSRIMDDVVINDNLLPYSLSYTTPFLGKESNRVLYKLTRTVGSGTPDDILFGSAGASYDTLLSSVSGQDGMGIASLFLYDSNGNPLVYIQALSPGNYGNSLRVTVRPQSPGAFRIEVTDEQSVGYNVPIKPESFSLSNYSVDPETGMYTETLDSNLIRAYFVPVLTAAGESISESTYDLTPQRIAPALETLATSSAVDNPLHPSHRGVAYLKDLYLTGGTQPSTFALEGPDESDYVDAVRRLEENDCAIISIAGVTVSDARYETAITELLVQAERSTTLNGLRIAVIAAPPSLSESRAQTLTSGISSSRAVIVSGWNTLTGTRYLGTNSLSPEGYYVGTLAVISPHVSPASVSAGRSIVGPLTVDTKGTPQFLDTLTKARIEALHYDSGLKMFKFLNGITTSSDPFERYVSIRRLTDQIVMDLYRNLQWVRSAPNTRSQRARVATACDAYLRKFQREEILYAFQPTICDESNNTITDMSSGRMNVRITFTPVYPADFIRVQVVRDLSTEFSLSTSG